MGIIRVIDAKTGELKRFEDGGGSPLAKVKRANLFVTAHGSRAGYSAKGLTMLLHGSKTW